MEKAKYHFIYLFFICLILSAYKVNASECGVFGSVEDRVKNCKQTYDKNFKLLSKLSNGHTFWFDNNTKLAWHYPFASSIASGNYDEIKAICKSPYRLANRVELVDIAKYDSIPFKLETNKVIVRKRRGGSSITRRKNRKLHVFDFYFDFTDKKRKINRANKSDTTKYHILCVANLENHFLFERTR